MILILACVLAGCDDGGEFEEVDTEQQTDTDELMYFMCDSSAEIDEYSLHRVTAWMEYNGYSCDNY